jgi:hypothetical protein
MLADIRAGDIALAWLGLPDATGLRYFAIR